MDGETHPGGSMRVDCRKEWLCEKQRGEEKCQTDNEGRCKERGENQLRTISMVTRGGWIYQMKDWFRLAWRDRPSAVSKSFVRLVTVITPHNDKTDLSTFIIMNKREIQAYFRFTKKKCLDVVDLVCWDGKYGSPTGLKTLELQTSLYIYCFSYII